MPDSISSYNLKFPATISLSYWRGGARIKSPPFLNYKSKCAHHKASISPDRQTTSGWLFSRSPVSSLFNLMTYMVQKNSRSVLQRAWLNGCISTSPEANQTKPNQIKPKPIKQKPNQTKTTWSGWNLLKILPIGARMLTKSDDMCPEGEQVKCVFLHHLEIGEKLTDAASAWCLTDLQGWTFEWMSVWIVGERTWCVLGSRGDTVMVIKVEVLGLRPRFRFQFSHLSMKL